MNYARVSAALVDGRASLLFDDVNTEPGSSSKKAVGRGQADNSTTNDSDIGLAHGAQLANEMVREGPRIILKPTLVVQQAAPERTIIGCSIGDECRADDYPV